MLFVFERSVSKPAWYLMQVPNLTKHVHPCRYGAVVHLRARLIYVGYSGDMWLEGSSPVGYSI